MDNRPIGVFDSGLGGLTAVVELEKLMPNENIIYFGDTGRVPYGTRSRQTIIKYAKQDAAFLKKFNIKALLVACGTVSSVALEETKNICNVKVFGVVDSAVKKAIESAKSKKIGVLGTSATIRSGAFESKIKQIDNSITVYSKACPLFVHIVENGFFERDCEIARAVVKEYLYDFKQNNVDCIILGCTHFPILSQAISDYMGNDVVLIDTGKEAADSLHNMLLDNDMLADREQGTSKFYVSDTASDFSAAGSIFMKRDILSHVEKIDIDKETMCSDN